ncbi:MAG: lamin tail domain-containing protein [Candidatus Marinimicrobia bacterium]|nr:lamin tail domain-containing protein [Candidatus Neomarinimicrobiota bacterium]MCF7850881.1 lamin tail domain-containing protein [Candidatus Neomarinimicrobiota bacterium]MCF7904166.1 lamin tail domain-containing protein [Candidatus Neomarinimicrobiota bacterium]
MKNRIIQFIVMSVLPFALLATDHLLISEVVLQPSAGEYIRITNPTGSDIDLSNYYLTDATDKANSKFYYNLPSGANYWSASSTDFIARFPSMTLKADSSLILGMGRTTDYSATYGSDPDLALKDDMLDAVNGVTTIGGSPNVKLENTAEGLILFYWDGSAATVQDVEYLIWGTDSSTASAYMIDKSGVSGYLADTPVSSQSYMPTHFDGAKLIRNSDEGVETTSGGNGITGHDETSEDLSATWSVVDLTIVKPVISNVSLSPSSPTTEDDLTITATVIDTTGLASVLLTYTFPASSGTPVDLTMSNASGDIWSVTIPATGTAGTLAYYLTATNTNGLTQTSNIYGADIIDPPTPLTIQTIIENSASYLGQTVTLSAVVSIGSGILRTDRTDMYIQDNSGYGLNMNQQGLLSPPLLQGDSISVTGTVDEYQGALQLTDFNYTMLAQDRPVPNIAEISTEDLNSLQFGGRFVKVSGVVSSRADNVGGGSNIVIEDGYGQVTLRVWDTTNLFADATADSLLQPGNLVDVWGIADEYNGEGQMMLAYATDVQALKEGEDGSGGTRLTVAPFPFDPMRGERIKYFFSFPENAHITVRVFDLSGRFITTLFDGYRNIALEVEKLWDGRTETYKLVPPGTYIMHLETVNRTTGETIHDTAPVIIAIRAR